MRSRRFISTAALVLGIVAAGVSGAVVQATHSWGGYHWARTGSSFDLIVVNSTTTDWDAYVTGATSDWSGSNVVRLVEDPSGSTSDRDRRQCRAPEGKVRICNLAYGFNGWLGIAGISIDVQGHIVSGYTKLNDSYFGTATYNTPAWKQSVACQELGHNLGLDHQDEDFNNASLESCMDYQNPPYPYADDHDFQQLGIIYGHTDSYDSYAAADGGDSGGGACTAPPGKGCNKAGIGHGNADAGWGMSVGRRGVHETFLRIDPDGTRHITFVRWVERG
jgi:hypothetical protein